MSEAPSEADAPTELIIDAKPPPGDASDGSGLSAGRIAVPVGAAAMLAKFVSPTAGGVALAVAVAYLLFTRQAKEGRTVLRLNAGTLEITREGDPDPRAVLPLTDVLEVTIDRTPQPQSQQKERVRLSIERRAADPIFVPEQPITPIEAQEWFFKVRVFLRKQGWLPAEERNNPIDPPDPSH